MALANIARANPVVAFLGYEARQGKEIAKDIVRVDHSKAKRSKRIFKRVLLTQAPSSCRRSTMERASLLRQRACEAVWLFGKLGFVDLVVDAA